ncbi:MAG: alpha/beta fold hydrolase, partial [Gordonia amarae]
MSCAAEDSAHRRSTHRVLASDGTALSATQWRGPRVDHTIVFLHGLCLNATTWNAQIDATLDKFGPNTRVVAYDHRGHGFSGSAAVSSYTVDQLASDLEAVLSSLDVSGPVTLVGHSLGGMTALAYVCGPARSHTVSGLVLVATAAGNLTAMGPGRLLKLPGINVLAAGFGRLPNLASRGAAHGLCSLLRRLGAGASA